MNEFQQLALKQFRSQGWLIADLEETPEGQLWIEAQHWKDPHHFTRATYHLTELGLMLPIDEMPCELYPPSSLQERNSSDWLLYHPLAPLPEPIEVRQTPAGECTVDQLLKRGDIVNYRYHGESITGEIVSLSSLRLTLPLCETSLGNRMNWFRYPLTRTSAEVWAIHVVRTDFPSTHFLQNITAIAPRCDAERSDKSIAGEIVPVLATDTALSGFRLLKTQLTLNL